MRFDEIIYNSESDGVGPSCRLLTLSAVFQVAPLLFGFPLAAIEGNRERKSQRKGLFLLTVTSLCLIVLSKPPPFDSPFGILMVNLDFPLMPC
ncbi:Hypothetical protein NTJ_11350 [Nesidiocoris tenuis]|uniref:Major facilitator superfamily associated domain-containing protein n=1 Tax=Nesidiocoris tenuis TaxID=355587 RepID=A0ABN7B5T0_9HEMI|nr:Hypothetical protein NTJ_11350 [Nesidiocoris tenuis]